MKRLALLAVALGVTSTPAQLLNMVPGVEQPDFACREDGLCAIRAEVLRELIHNQHQRCERFL